MASNSIVTVTHLAKNNEKIKEQLATKVNIEQGVGNKGKLLGIDDNGKVTVVDKPESVKISTETGNIITQKTNGLFAEDTIVEIQIDGTPLTITDKKVNLTGFITKAVNDLENYYLKTETYNKEEVDNLLKAISTLKISKVDTLPTTDISTTIIYLLPKTDTDEKNVYAEYINLDGTENGWECIGDTKVDLTEYAKTADVEKLIENAVYTTTTVEAHYEITDSTTANALEVVADGTATDGQIDISSVTPLPDNITVTEGDYVVWVEAVETTNEKYVLKVDGKGLSTNDLTDELLEKLNKADIGVVILKADYDVLTEEQKMSGVTFYVPDDTDDDSTGNSHIDLSEYTKLTDLENYLPLTGGSLTGIVYTRDLCPNSDGIYNSAWQTTAWKNVYSNKFDLYKNGANYGHFDVGTEGTESVAGYTRLTLGNNINADSVGNAQGYIILYGYGTGYTSLKPSNNGESSVVISLPNATGTLALKSDVESVIDDSNTSSETTTLSAKKIADSIKLNMVKLVDSSTLSSSETTSITLGDISDYQMIHFEMICIPHGSGGTVKLAIGTADITGSQIRDNQYAYMFYSAPTNSSDATLGVVSLTYSNGTLTVGSVSTAASGVYSMNIYGIK